MKPLDIQVKDDYKKEVVGFNNSGAPLGQRDDLHLLIEMGHTANPSLLRFFKDPIPTLKEVQAYKEGKFLEQNPDKAPASAAPAGPANVPKP